ncbi:MAG: cell division protein FtsQ/DivIB [Rhodoferax sp.]
MAQPSPTPLDVRLMNGTATALFLAFAVLAVWAALGWVLRLPLFAIRSITVEGDVAHNNALTLRANVLPQMRGTFFTADLAQVRRAFEAVPWVRHAVVQRAFPNALRVRLQEHQAFAFWGLDAEAKLLNVQGEVFEANTGEVEPDSLPHLYGPQAHSAEVLAMYQALGAVLAPLELGLDELELRKSGSWRARLDSGTELELGRGAHTEVLERARRYVHTVTQVSARYGRWPQAVESADLRYENGYALRLRGVSTVSNPAAKK